ncbi:MAG: hypothetical protein LBD29_01710 [Treponema sp.]|nr:hypothetical protein [Treponema sp.]
MEKESHCTEASHERLNRVSYEDCNSSPLQERELARRERKVLSEKTKFRLKLFDWYWEYLSGFFAFRDRRTRRSPAGISAFTGHSSTPGKNAMTPSLCISGLSRFAIPNITRAFRAEVKRRISGDSSPCKSRNLSCLGIL